MTSPAFLPPTPGRLHCPDHWTNHKNHGISESKSQRGETHTAQDSKNQFNLTQRTVARDHIESGDTNSTNSPFRWWKVRHALPAGRGTQILPRQSGRADGHGIVREDQLARHPGWAQKHGDILMIVAIYIYILVIIWIIIYHYCCIADHLSS